jgi:anti-anti-sigma factor
MDDGTSTRTIAGRPVVTLDGVIDLVAIPVVRDLLHRVILEHPAATVLVDLDGVTGLDDCGFGVLVGAAAARERGGDLEVVCTSSRLRDRLSLTRLDRLFTVRETAA